MAMCVHYLKMNKYTEDSVREAFAWGTDSKGNEFITSSVCLHCRSLSEYTKRMLENTKNGQ